MHVLDPQNPTSDARCVLQRRPRLEYFVEHYQHRGSNATDSSGGSSSSSSSSGSSSSSSSSNGSGSSAVEADALAEGRVSQADGRLLLLTNSGASGGELRVMSAALGESEGCSPSPFLMGPLASSRLKFPTILSFRNVRSCSCA